MTDAREAFGAEAEELAVEAARGLRAGDDEGFARAVHTLKGVAGALGATRSVALCHALEGALHARPGDPDAEELLREGAALLLPCVTRELSPARQGIEDLDDGAVREVVAALGALNARPRWDAPTVDPVWEARLTEAQHGVVQRRLARGDALREVTFVAKLEDSPEAEARALAAVGSGAEVLGRALAPTDDGAIAWTLLVGLARRHAPRGVSVRVSIERMEAWMHEVLEAGAAARTLARLGDRPDLAKLARDLERSVAALKRGMLAARMVPLEEALGAAAGEVRRLARAAGLRVRVTVEGGATEVDRVLGEALVGPLTHLARNAVDHGLDTPEVRLRAGKDPEASVSFRARRKGATVQIEVDDDGRGVDTDSLLARAIALGRVTPAEAERMGLEARVELAFLRGVSSRTEVTETSGRGLGMDAVRASLAPLGATVALQSTPGQGTRVVIESPVTLALVTALIVQIDRQRWAIPMAALAEVKRAEGGGYVVTVARGGLRARVSVEALEGWRDLAVRPLDPAWGEVPGVAGVAECDGGLVRVLDAPPRERIATEPPSEDVGAAPKDDGGGLIVHTNGRRWRLPWEGVREVLGAVPLTPLPGARRAMLGVVLWRARVVPVYSLNDPPDAPGTLVLVERGAAWWALQVERVERVVRAGESGEVLPVLAWWEQVHG